MITALIGPLVGLLGAFVPEFFKTSQDKRDKAHELAIMELQLKQQAQGAQQKLEEVQTVAIAQEAVALQESYRAELPYSGRLAASVRPVVTYLFVFEYMAIKIALLCAVLGSMSTLPWNAEASFWAALEKAIPLVWGEADMGLFGGIVAFWFSGRAIAKKG